MKPGNSTGGQERDLSVSIAGAIPIVFFAGEVSLGDRFLMQKNVSFLHNCAEYVKSAFPYLAESRWHHKKKFGTVCA